MKILFNKHSPNLTGKAVGKGYRHIRKVSSDLEKKKHAKTRHCPLQIYNYYLVIRWMWNVRATMEVCIEYTSSHSDF